MPFKPSKNSFHHWICTKRLSIIAALFSIANPPEDNPMPKLTTVYWRDIPAQVIAKERRENSKLVLTERFAIAIDKAAMRAKMAGTDAYLEQWRQESVKCGNDLKASVDAAAAKLEQAYDDDRLGELVRSGGVEAE